MTVATLVVLPLLGTGGPLRTTGKDVAASSVTPAFGKPAETKKALYVVALSRSTLRSFGGAPPSRPRKSLASWERPRARANLGRRYICTSQSRCKGNIRLFSLAAYGPVPHHRASRCRREERGGRGRVQL